MRSLAPPSSEMLPLPDHTPAIPANGADWATAAIDGTAIAAATTAARTRKRGESKTAVIGVFPGCGLSTRSFPAPAAGNAARGAVPFAGAGIAVELAIRESGADRDANHPAGCDLARHFGAGSRDAAIGHRERIVGRTVAATRLRDDGDIPKTVIRMLRQRRRGRRHRRGQKGEQRQTNAIETH